MNAKRFDKFFEATIGIVLVVALCFHVYLSSKEHEIWESEKCRSYENKECTDDLWAVIYNITTCITTRWDRAKVQVSLENDYYTTICQKQ